MYWGQSLVEKYTKADTTTSYHIKSLSKPFKSIFLTNQQSFLIGLHFKERYFDRHDFDLLGHTSANISSSSIDKRWS